MIRLLLTFFYLAFEALIPDPAVEPIISVERAGRILSLGRSAAYEAARRGELPTIRLWRRLVCPTAALRRLVCLDEPTDYHPAQEPPIAPASSSAVLPFANRGGPARSSP